MVGRREDGECLSRSDPLGLARTLILSVVPAIAFAIAFFFFEQSVVIPEYREFFAGAVMAAGGQPEMARSVALDPASVRHEVWASLLLIFFRNPQSVAMLVVVGLVAPRLISADLRNRGYLLYFSRPVTPTGYVAGKALVVWTVLGTDHYGTRSVPVRARVLPIARL